MTRNTTVRLEEASFLQPLHTLGFYHWESTDERFIITIAPAWLRCVALKNDCLKFNEIKILPAF